MDFKRPVARPAGQTPGPAHGGDRVTSDFGPIIDDIGIDEFRLSGQIRKDAGARARNARRGASGGPCLFGWQCLGLAKFHSNDHNRLVVTRQKKLFPSTGRPSESEPSTGRSARDDATRHRARAVLRWYDSHARALPWRVGPQAIKDGAVPDPYRVWLSEIMLQQTTVATVINRYQEFLSRWPNVGAMARSDRDDILAAWAGLGYYARARNLHKCAQMVVDVYGGVFPDTEDELRKLPGIGDYTAAAIAAIAFNRRAIVVDGNIERIMARVFSIETPLPVAKVEIKQAAETLWPKSRHGDFAQSLMDIGAEICRPKSPSCLLCPLRKGCGAHNAGRAQDFPVKAPKAEKVRRNGVVYALANGKGEILFERRPEKGLLGGMLGLPGSAWVDNGAPVLGKDAPAQVQWSHCGDVVHLFTHIHLSLDVYTALAPKGFRRANGQKWILPERADLPTLMRKAVDCATSREENKK